MAVKRTHDLIPFCHPLPIDGCGLTIDWINETSLRIECAVRTIHRTGVQIVKAQAYSHKLCDR